MRRPTSLDRITREGRPKTWGTAIVRARAESNDIILPDGPRLSGVQAEGIDMSGRNVDVPPGLHGKTARKLRKHVIAHARPAPQALRRAPDLRRVLLSRRLHISRLRKSPFQMTHAVFHRKTTQIRPEHKKNGDAKAPPPGTGPAHLCAAYSASACPTKAVCILPRSCPCTATLAPQLCLPEGLRHTVFWKVLPKSCLFLLHGAFSMYIFSRIKNKTPLRSKRNNVNERIGLITGMI